MARPIAVEKEKHEKKLVLPLSPSSTTPVDDNDLLHVDELQLAVRGHGACAVPQLTTRCGFFFQSCCPGRLAYKSTPQSLTLSWTPSADKRARTNCDGRRKGRLLAVGKRRGKLVMANMLLGGAEKRT
ncbi:hypothetical protein PPTG_19201 [Phytophthora nicotianae INRA-310]|uniref:Uncharacterized protein n=1 Tax=Phytophthora nicotianae (strain INRA-310) TaxID=761204 RepID=W2PDF9_PHYN3|nr:hypothetical protein PPTG_19201 [Phytophthora nicotianae INRA-310]ETM98866.1 hypothetical protein PPTG_19201 [Phytophthora nicotianae INRA-310]